MLQRCSVEFQLRAHQVTGLQKVLCCRPPHEV
jgi:hypothetical protein